MLRKTLSTMLLGLSTILLLGGCAESGDAESDAAGGVSSSGASPAAETASETASGEEITAAAATSSTRVTDDPIEAAYFGVYVWKAAVEKAQSFEIDKVREAVYGLEFDAPGGKKSMHKSNQHTLKPVYIGEILKDGQFKIVKAFNDGKLVSPDSYSTYLHKAGEAPAPTGGPQEGKTYPQAEVTEAVVKIGILHSLSGTMAISETSLKDVVLYAVDEINSTGGILGRQIEVVIEDPASDWDLFAEKARKMITTDKVSVIFGCWTSVSRKSVLPVFEEYNHLLFYPVQYEGEEQSKNVFYTAATPNQQLVPAAQYMIDEGYKKFYLLGTDYVFPRTANKVLKAFLKAKGVPDENIIEKYTPFHHQDYQTYVQEIKKFSAGGDACILSTINGDSNVPFYKEFANQGLTAADCPIMAFSVAEDELRAMDVPPLVGHLACWNYYQSIDTPGNRAFVTGFQAFCKKNNLK
jgi:urea ABC transporter urea binding protein